MFSAIFYLAAPLLGGIWVLMYRAGMQGMALFRHFYAIS